MAINSPRYYGNDLPHILICDIYVLVSSKYFIISLTLSALTPGLFVNIKFKFQIFGNFLDIFLAFKEHNLHHLDNLKFTDLFPGPNYDLSWYFSSKL
jgi:hypothetical protein